MKRIISLFACLCILFTAQSQIFKETGLTEADQAAVVKNLEELNKVSYKEFTQFSEDLQRFIFVNIEPENKARLWQERIFYYLETNRESVEIISALKKLTVYLSGEYFSHGANASKVEEWVRQHVKLFGRDKLGYIITTMRPAALGLGDIPQPNPGNTSPSPTTLSCNCSQSSDWCFGNSAYCKPWACNISTRACGTFWNYDCNGRCYTPNG